MFFKLAVDKVQTEAKFKLELLQKEYEGERNVLESKIASFEPLVKDQSARISSLGEQVEKILRASTGHCCQGG